MKVADATVKGTQETVQNWIDRGYALFVPESPFCLESVGFQLPEGSILKLLVPGQNCSSVPLFLINRKPLLDGRVSHPDKVRLVLAQELLNGEPTRIVHLEPFRATDEQVAGLVKDILGVAMGEE